MTSPRAKSQVKLNVGSDRLAASGWGTSKPSSRMGSQAPASGHTTARTDHSSIDGPQPKKALEDHINLEVMLKLKEVFAQADADGGGDLDAEEFVEAFDGILGDGNREQLRKLFMRIDANSDGSVDWGEFSTFILLENQGAANLRESESVLQFHPSKMPDKVPPELAHRAAIMRIAHLPPGSGAGERYATAGKDGTVRLWSIKDLSHHKTICNGTAWVTSVVYTPVSHKLAVSSFARTIKLYDAMNGEVVGSATELDHAAYTLDCAAMDKSAQELMIAGDIGGCVTVMDVQFQDPQENKFIDADVKREDQFRFKKVWREELHKDWVSNAKYVQDLAGVVTSSLDNTLAIVDIEKRIETKRMVGHTKGVHAFEWSALYKFIASAGMDRKVMLWNPFSQRHIAILQGHAASVHAVAVNERDNQIISMSMDKAIKVWDIRNHKCMQTFYDEEMYRPENIISSMMYDSQKRWLVTGNTKLKTWPLRSVINKTSGAHAASVSCVLYSPNFAEAITADHAGTVCVWVVRSGELRFRFTNAHDGHRITCMALDSNHRRLITGSDNGVMKMWNFSSGACIKTMVPKGVGTEVTGIACTQGMYFNNHVLCVGWDRKITFYEDDTAKLLSPIRQIGQKGHKGDILSVSIMEGSGTLATSGYEGHILIWNVDSGAVKQRLVPPDIPQYAGVDGGPPEDVAIEKVQFMFEKLHHVLIAVSADRRLRIWDALEGRLLLAIRTNHKLGESIVSLACRTDNQYITTGDSGGWIKVWDTSKLTGERIPKEMADVAVQEHACWQAHRGAVADMAWVGKLEPYFLSCSSDMHVTLWSLDGAKLGDFGKDEWQLRDESSWITRGSEQMIADPNDGITDPGSFADQLRSILTPPSSREQSPTRKTRPTTEPAASMGAEESPYVDSVRIATDDIPNNLLIDVDCLKPPPSRRGKGGKGTGKKELWQDPRMEKVYMPHDSKRINHTGTQGREKSSIHHLIHVSELQDVQAPEGSQRGHTERSGLGGDAGSARPQTVPAGVERSRVSDGQPDGSARRLSSARSRGGRQKNFATGFGDFSQFSKVRPEDLKDQLSPEPSF